MTFGPLLTNVYRLHGVSSEPPSSSPETLNWVNFFLASDELKDIARKWIDRLSVKNGSYPPDSYPNPGEQVTINTF